MDKIRKPGIRISRLLLVGMLAMVLLSGQIFLFSGGVLADISTSVTIIGSDPLTAPVVQITPEKPQPGEDLTCSITVVSTDDDPASIRYTYDWYKNGALQAGLTLADTTSLANTIDGSGTTAGEIWKCVVTPNNGSFSGPSAQDEVTIAAEDEDGGIGGGGGSSGGGGGGGGAPSGVTSLAEYITNEGVFVADNVTIYSADGKVRLTIRKGTTGKNAAGQTLYSISIKPAEEPPAPPEDNTFICLNYNLTPSGATFDPPISLTFFYDDSQVPEGVPEENLVLGTYYDGKWVTFDNCVVNPANNTITVKISHFSIYTVMANTAPATLTVTGITVTPNEVYQNETVTVSTTVTNKGGLTGSKDVTLTMNNVALQTTKVTLDGGKSQTVTFTVTVANAGKYVIEVNGLSSMLNVKPAVASPEGSVTNILPASFIISNLAVVPGEVNASGEVTISALVTNIGNSEGTYTAVLKINGVEETRKDITLGAGQNGTVVFNIAKSTGGIYSVDIAGNAGQFTVIAPPPATTQTPAKTTPPPPASTNWWIVFGTIAGVIIVVRLLTYLYQKRSINM